MNRQKTRKIVPATIQPTPNRRRRAFAHYLVGVSVVGFLACLPANASPSDPQPNSPIRWGVWLAGSDTTPTILSRVPRKFGIAAVQLNEDLMTTPHFHLEYTCDFIPVLIVHQRAESRVGYLGPGALEQINQPSKSIWGMGIAPIGLRLNVVTHHPITPYLAASTGGAYTTEKIPYQIPGGTNLNFLFQMGGGLRWTLSPRQDLLFGFSWWHLSNGRLAVVNPGIDANLWSLTYIFS